MRPGVSRLIRNLLDVPDVPEYPEFPEPARILLWGERFVFVEVQQKLAFFLDEFGVSGGIEGGGGPDSGINLEL